MSQHITSFYLFVAVGCVGERLIPSSQSKALNLEALPLQREDLSPDETMAHFRVLIDEIRDLQETRITCMQ